MILRNHADLSAHFEELGPTDILVGRLRLRSGEEHLLVDLLARGVRMIPSARSQLLSRSKVFQARILGNFMVPGTRPIYTIHDIMAAVADYGHRHPGPVVCKLDRANGGRGILRFSSVEDVYTQAALGTLPFPFLLQPLLPECKDVRIIRLGDYTEAYQRYNPTNFRHNLHCGGTSRPWELDDQHREFCEQVLQRADFPYGHIDLLITPDNRAHLSEVNLRGGLRGARITPAQYRKLQQEVEDRLLAIVNNP